MTTTDSRRIRALNDAFRAAMTASSIMLQYDQFVVTRGVIARGIPFLTRAVAAVRAFSAFTPDNDPYEEHDFGAFELDGTRLNWKLDYYDLSCVHGSTDPADPAKTRRVLTLLLADEY